MAFSCFYCNAETDLKVYFDPVTFACPSCGRVYEKKDGEYKFKSKFSGEYEHTGIALGKKGILKGKEYTIGGILSKKADGDFYWKEYILHNEAQEFVFLSEAYGHWVFLKEIDNEAGMVNYPKSRDYQGTVYDLYEHSSAEIISALGYFDFDVSKHWVKTMEFINPPKMISVETVDGAKSTFLGEHISAGEVKKAFQLDDMPRRNGVGLIQPFIFNLRALALIFCSVAILIVLSNWVLNNDRVEQEVLNATLNFDELINKEFVTPSFELKGSSAPLSVIVSSNVDNSWANLQLTLVNEKTGEEVYANKDIEYYHGYTDGENWSEGSTSEEFNVCGVSQGKYHLALTPMKAETDTTNTDIYIKASWNKPSGRNVWLTCVFMVVLLVIIYYISRRFETLRWEDSDYSPYSE